MREIIPHHRTITVSLNKSLIAEVSGKYSAIEAKRQYGRAADKSTLIYVLAKESDEEIVVKNVRGCPIKGHGHWI